MHRNGNQSYIQLGNMRRIFSITAIVALIASSFSPLMAATMHCAGMSKASMSCHGGEDMASCDRHMHGHHHQAAAPTESSPSFSGAEDNPKCPMDCCAPGHITTVAASSSVSLIPPMAASNRNFHFVAVTFVSVGFSSHTDRGPPSLFA